VKEVPRFVTGTLTKSLSPIIIQHTKYEIDNIHNILGFGLPKAIGSKKRKWNCQQAYQSGAHVKR
jgi:hypothetical protein